MGLTHVQRVIRCDTRTIEPPGSLTSLRRLVARRRGVALESVSKEENSARYSIFAFDPVKTVCLQGEDGIDPFHALAAVWHPLCRLKTKPDLPFIGGWVGFLGYEAARFAEPSAGWDDRASRLPLAYWSLFDTVLLCDTRLDQWIVAGVELPIELTATPRPPLEQRLGQLERMVKERVGEQAPASQKHPHPNHGVWNDSKAVYFEKVIKSLDYIREGDIFQVNLARRFRIAMSEHPITLYQRLCETNPAAYAAYLSIDHQDAGHDRSAAVISSSPELFLKLQGRTVTTKPIKGTSARGESESSDAASAAALAQSSKDRAELNMIIDLERNDLGRVCEYGSVRVLSDGEIEKLPTVFHRTATITGRLRDGLDAIDLLRAVFPGGSITGAPKVRAMQIINELETDARGPYCGAIGYVGLDGDMQLNLAIRTMSMIDGQADLWVGSGIVADSDPQTEFLELEDKAAGMMEALMIEQTRPVAPVSNRWRTQVTNLCHSYETAS